MQSKKQKPLFVNANTLLQEAKYNEYGKYYTVEHDKKSHTMQPIVIVVDKGKRGGPMLVSVQEEERKYRNPACVLEIALKSKDNPLSEYESPFENTEVFAVLTPKAEYYTDVDANLIFNFRQVTVPGANDKKQLKLYLTVLANRDASHWDFTDGRTLDLDELASSVKLLADGTVQAADEREEKLRTLLEKALGGKFFGLSMHKARKYAHAEAEVHASIYHKVETMLGGLARFKASSSKPQGAMAPTSMALMGSFALLHDFKATYERARLDHPAKKQRVEPNELVAMQARICMQALELDVKGMARVLSVAPRTVYHWLAGDIYGPRLYARLSALMLLIMANPSLATK